jgi:hypothetical protein
MPQTVNNLPSMVARRAPAPPRKETVVCFQLIGQEEKQN